MNTRFIKKVELKKTSIFKNEYYSEIPVIKNFSELEFNYPITFFVGENGSGKSTLLEAIAISYGFNPEGGSLNFRFQTKNTHSSLSDFTLLSKGVKAKDGYFLRAESFYNTSSYIEDIYKDDPVMLNQSYGRSLHQCSHGESFMSLIQHRFRGNGIYILDEPEAALSPQRQLSLILRINELVNDNSQFLIATHSPILLGMDNAQIFTFDNQELETIAYEETDSFTITKLFVENRMELLRRLGGN